MLDAKKIGNIDCYIFNADIVSQHADTMLVPVPQTQAGKGGVFAAAKSAGAIAGCEALENWHELSSEYMKIGECLTVPSGGGETSSLTHVASVCEFGTSKEYNFAAVVLSVQSVLEDMKKKGLSSVNIPLMGTGQVGWLSPEQSARAMLIGIQHFVKQNPDAHMRINLFARDEENKHILEHAFSKPDLYTDVTDSAILGEEGKAVPFVANLETYRAGGFLAHRLNGATATKFSSSRKSSSHL